MGYTSTDNHSSSDNSKSAALVLAVESAFSMFDEPVKRALYFHLKQKGADVHAENTDLESIETALRDVMGAGAEIITLCIHKEIDRLAIH
jgi:hypothetical protein